jgi:hypothetical protein
LKREREYKVGREIRMKKGSKENEKKKVKCNSYEKIQPLFYYQFIIYSYFMAQQPLESFARLLMRVSLSYSILVTLIFY